MITTPTFKELNEFSLFLHWREGGVSREMRIILLYADVLYSKLFLAIEVAPTACYGKTKVPPRSSLWPREGEDRPFCSPVNHKRNLTNLSASAQKY